MRKVPRVLILWGVPGVGKSTYADWLAQEQGFLRIDSDAGEAGASRVARAWRAMLSRLGTPEQFATAKEFVKVARYNPQPVVAEYGMGATLGGIELLGELRIAGAEAWWFDGDRPAAFAAWKAENIKAPRNMEDAYWHHVVSAIDANMAMIAAFFGPNIARTIESGPTHIPPEKTFRTMFGEDP